MKRPLLVLLSLPLLLAGCGKIGDALDNANTYLPQMDTLKANTSDTNGYLGQMLAAVHDQALAQSLAVMFSDQALKFFPSSTVGEFPGAEGFANHATPEEVVKLAKVFILEVNQGLRAEFDDRLSQYAQLTSELQAIPADKAGEKEAKSKEVNATRATLIADAKKANIDKKIRLFAIRAVAGFMSQAKTEQLVHEQLDPRGGSYEQAAVAVLLYRADQFKTARLEGDLLADGTVNAKQLADAMEFAGYVEYIASLPKALHLDPKRFSFATTGMLPENPDKWVQWQNDGGDPAKYGEVAQQDIQDMSNYSPDKMQTLWESIQSVKDTLLGDPTLPAVQKTEIKSKLEPKIQNRVQYWTAKANSAA